MKSKNIVFTGLNQVEVWSEDVASVGENQLLVETQSTLISTGTEGIILNRKFEANSHWDNWIKYPFHPGYNNVARVIEVGANVTDWKVGDRVASRSPHHQYRVLDAGSSGNIRVPDAISNESASWFGMSNIVQTGVHAARHHLGDSVVIIGSGILGQLVTQYAYLSGASQIIVIDMAQKRLEMAKAHGATHTLQMPVGEAREKVWELTNNRGADIVYDVTGHAPVFAPALGLARKYGKMILLGDTGTPSEQRLTSDIVSRGVRIIGAHDTHTPSQENDAQYWTAQHMTELFFTYLERGQMRVDDLITHRYAPDEAVAAYEMLNTARDSAMGVVFDWTQK